jgi:16S rRNA (guanine966-N2)-methyltransferase
MNKSQVSAKRVRIIAGFWRSRLLEIALQPGLRPTTDRVRETVFNWLNPYLQGAVVYDLFAGTGILGLEACSRGAMHVTLIEKNPIAYRVLKSNLADLQPMPDGSSIDTSSTDALTWLRNLDEINAKVIFLDPPFDTPALLLESLRIIAQKTKNHNRPIIYVESNAKLDNGAILEFMPQWEFKKQLIAGVVKASLLTLKEEDSSAKE